MIDDLSERLRQHGNWLYGIGEPEKRMTAPDFLDAGARIDRLQAELDRVSGQLERVKPLDRKQMNEIAALAQIKYCLDKFGSFAEAVIRLTEKAHGIEEKTNGT